MKTAAVELPAPPPCRRPSALFELILIEEATTAGAVALKAGGQRAWLDSLVAEAISALDELHELAREILPAVSAEGGLRPALGARPPLRRPGRLDVQVDGLLPEQIEIADYYVVAQAVVNIAKHAHASAAYLNVNADARCNCRRATTASAAPTQPATAG